MGEPMSTEELAHSFSARCTGGTGHGVGGDGPRWHTKQCDKLAKAFDKIARECFAAGHREGYALALEDVAYAIEPLVGFNPVMAVVKALPVKEKPDG